MVYEQYDFAPNPIVENREFSVESKCLRCGSSVVARSLEELLEEEKRHRAECISERRGLLANPLHSLANKWSDRFAMPTAMSAR
jgi:hypothetical protein